MNRYGSVSSCARVAWLACALLAIDCGDDGGQAARDVVSDTSVLDPAVLVIDRGDESYGTVVLGVQSALIRWVVTNTGETASGPIALDLTGSASFIIGSNTCTRQLSPGQTCAVSIAFRPATAGPDAATFALSATPGGTVGAALSGEGILPGALAIELDTSDLGSAIIGATSPTTATVTLRNTGALPTGPILLYLGNPDPIDFAIIADACKQVVLKGGESCTLEIAFSPRSNGPKSSSLEARATPGGRVSGTVVGIGQAQAALYTTVKDMSFGVSVLGVTVRATINVANLGDTPSGVVDVTLSGDGAGAYEIDGCGGEALAPNELCVVDVTFAPFSAGPQPAQLEIRADPGGVLMVPLSGIGVVSLLSIDPRSALFDPLLIGTFSDAATFIITNNGLRTSGTLRTELVGDATNFELVEDGCDAVNLGPGAGCRVRARFTPVDGGPVVADIIITSPTSGVVRAALEGTGLFPPTLVVTPPDNGFGVVPLGRDSAVQRFEIENTGGLPTGLVDVVIEGAAADQFEIVSNECLARLLPEKPCEVEVRFAPSVIGTADAMLVVTSTPGGTAVATLEAESVSPDQLVVPPSFDFAATLVGESVTQAITIENDSAAATGVIIISKTGLHANEFALSDDCDALAPHASCTLTVTFGPRGPGVRSASVNVLATPGGSPRIELTGLGVAPP